MCEYIRNKFDPKMKLGIVDLILWYGASRFGTSAIKSVKETIKKRKKRNEDVKPRD
jgi:hypothetical protein